MLIYYFDCFMVITPKFLVQYNNCICVDASLSYFSLEKTFKRKSVQVDFLFRGIHSEPQHSAVGCKVSQNLDFSRILLTF